MTSQRHPLEDPASHRSHHHRNLHHKQSIDALRLEQQAHIHDEEEAAKRQRLENKLAAKAEKKRRERWDQLSESSGIEKESVHGLMVSGSIWHCH